MWNGKKVGAIIPAAGQGTRMGGARAKQFLDLNGKPVLIHSTERFQISLEIDVIILVAAEDARPEIEALVDLHHLTKVAGVVIGGKERQDSVWNGLQTMAQEEPHIVLVHDAVRPLVSGEIIRNVCAAAWEFGAAVPGVTPTDTIKQIDGDKAVLSTLQRSGLRMIQTPQGFTIDLLLKAYTKATRERFYGTDDASLVERMGVKIMVVEGSYENIKITTPEDLKFAGFMLKETAINH